MNVSGKVQQTGVPHNPYSRLLGHFQDGLSLDRADLQLLEASVVAQIALGGTLGSPWPRSRRYLKRAFDLLGACLLLVVAAPVFLVLAVAVKLDSRGPLFFRQVRLGYLGHPFIIIKLRSMLTDAEHHKQLVTGLNRYRDPRFFKVQGDPRITRVGRFLRRTSLDELPQLWNVLRGQMSLVGPRPPLPEEVIHYDTHHFFRLTVKPGMTGLWQISDRNSIVAFDQVVRLDLHYIAKWSFWQDLSILVRTVPVVVRGHGAM